MKTTLDGRIKVKPEDDDGDEPTGELVGSAEYGPSGDHEYEPEGGDGGGDVFKAPREYKQKGQYGSGEYGHNGGLPAGAVLGRRKTTANGRGWSATSAATMHGETVRP